jgi:nitrogenase molybdenum-iron protein alpha/beta subunit
VSGRYSGGDSEAPAAGPSAVDRALRKNSDAAGKGYDIDARAIAKALVKHYGDEAEAVLKRAAQFLDEARRAKR